MNESPSLLTSTSRGLLVPSWEEKWRVRSVSSLKERCRTLRNQSHVISDLIPSSSLGIVVGDSGIGKSPFLYQAAICVAEGISFLGHSVTPGRVLYLDFENGLVGVSDLVDRLASHLGRAASSDRLLLWNFNDSNDDWRSGQLMAMVSETEPCWVIIDSLSAFSPEVEERSSNVTHVYQFLRTIIKEHQCAITVVHHLRKPSSKPDEAAPAIDQDPQGWLLQARGSRQLINGTDVRIGMDQSAIANAHTLIDGRSVEVAFATAGFGRLKGKIPPTYVGRVLGDDGEPSGYERLHGTNLLFNSDQETAFHILPPVFSFTDAKRCYGRRDQATDDFLKKCINVGLLRKEGRQYKKVTQAE